MAGRQGASGNFRNSFVSLRAATTRRIFLCLSVLRQTSFVLVQFLLPWNLLSQLPRSVMLRLAPKPASQKSDETLMIPAPLIRLYPEPPKEKLRSLFLQQRWPSSTVRGAGTEGSHLLEPGLWVQILSDSDVQSGG